jgi:hypothetical protein
MIENGLVVSSGKKGERGMKHDRYRPATNLPQPTKTENTMKAGKTCYFT